MNCKACKAPDRGKAVTQWILVLQHVCAPARRTFQPDSSRSASAGRPATRRPTAIARSRRPCRSRSLCSNHNPTTALLTPFQLPIQSCHSHSACQALTSAGTHDLQTGTVKRRRPKARLPNWINSSFPGNRVSWTSRASVEEWLALKVRESSGR